MTPLQASLDAVNAVLNQAIALDPDAPARVERLSGRSLGIAVTGTGMQFQLIPVGDQLQVVADPETEATVTIAGPPASLVALAGQEGTRVLFDGSLQVSGDVTAARAWKRLFDTLEPDWEEALARIAGDIPAHETGRVAAAIAAWARRARSGRAADLRAWLVNEVALLPARSAVEAWMRDVDRVRHDGDRLAARIRRLERRSSGE